MAKYLAVLFFIVTGFQLVGQKNCSMEEYVYKQKSENISLKDNLEQVELFTRQKTNSPGTTQRVNGIPEIIKVPVVFHILYQNEQQNIPIATLQLLIAALNRDFNKKNFDTVNIPSAFKPLAVSMDFEFTIATTDPDGKATSGVVRKYTPISYWLSDDKMKFSASYGADAWDSKSYLNVWICNMKDVLGYSTLPGMDPKKDGIVLSFDGVIGRGTIPTRNDLRTIVHEAGHWLNLYHLWGEGYCGDDKVDDTPKQGTYTPGCPSGARVTCGNGPVGDMYMNFMDFTDDACMNMFTNGQKKRARVLFETGGPRNFILYSKGLNGPGIPDAASGDFYPKWMHPQVYPNPASNSISIYFDYDVRWLGRKIQILDMSGRVVSSKIISSTTETFDVSRLTAGVYFIRAEKDEEKIHAKFIKR